MATRRRAIRKWSCPHHPEGPPTMPADGYDREELTLTEAFDDAFVAALQRLCALRVRDGEHVGRRLGVCCIGCSWRTVGYETYESSVFEDCLLSMRPPLYSGTSVLLSELSKPLSGEPVRIPIIKGPVK